MLRRCCKCKAHLNLSEFYILKKTGKEYGPCKECVSRTGKVSKDKRKHDPERKKILLERGWEKHLRQKEENDPKKRELLNRVTRVWAQKNPEKRLAMDTARHDRDKKGVKLEKGFQMHHWSYNPQHRIDTIIMATREHRKLHRYMTYDSDSLLYRRTDTMELLYTKEAHYAYYLSLADKP